MAARLETFGGLKLLTDGDAVAGKPLAVLVYLVTERRAIPRESLAVLLWPSLPREKALQSVRQALFLIKRSVGRALVITNETVAVDHSFLKSDLADLTEALQSRDVSKANELWRGDFCDNFSIAGSPHWWHWVEAAGDRLKSKYAALLSVSAEEARAALQYSYALELSRRAINVQPHEVSHRMRLINFLLDAGDVAAAFTALEDTKRDFSDPEFVPVLEQLDLRLRALTNDRHKDPYRSLAEPELVGRTVELSVIAAAWQKATRKETQVVAIVGPGGIGKTRLAVEAAKLAREHGAVIAISKASAGDETASFSALSGIISKLLRLPGAAGISAGSESVLTAIAPRFARAAANSAVPLPVAVGDALLDLVGAISFETPLFLVFDDLQWSDPQSRGVIRRLVRDVKNEAVVFCVAYRKDELQREVAVSLDRLERDCRANKIALNDLTTSDIAELLASTISFEEPECITGTAVAIFRATQGRPYLIADLLQRIADEEYLRFENGQWRIARAVNDKVLRSIGSTKATIERRLRDLGDTENHVLNALACVSSESLDDVRKEAGVDSATFTRTVGALVENRILRWNDNRLEFVQDAFREDLRLRVRESRLMKRRRRTAAIAGALLLVVAIASGGYWASKEPLYGGGSVIISDNDTLIELLPPRWRNSQWQEAKWTPQLPEYASVVSFSVDENGRRKIGANVQQPDSSPYVAIISPDTSVTIINRRFREDSGVGGFSPDGQWVLFTEDNPSTPRYDLYLYKARPDGGDRTLVRAAVSHLTTPTWSPDGSRILVRAAGGTIDTLVVLTPSGRELKRIIVPRVGATTWCDNQTAIFVKTGEDTGVWEADVRNAQVRRLAGVRPISLPVCSLDRKVVFAIGIIDGERSVILIDRRTGRISQPRLKRPLPRSASVLAWIPQRMPRTLNGIELLDVPASIAWGNSQQLRYAMRHAGFGPATAPRIEWASSDTSIVSVTSAGILVANRPGQAAITVAADGWLADTAVVEVYATARDPALYRDALTAFDSSRYYVIGRPALQTVADAENQVLHIPADGNYADGVITRAEFALRPGGVAEVEFKLPLTRHDRQYVTFALIRADPIPHRDPHQLTGWRMHEENTIAYPVEGSRDGVSVISGGITSTLSRTPAVADDWNHLAIQLRPDGYVSFFFNRKKIADSALRIDNPPDARWRVAILGSSYQTKLLIRNLLVSDQLQTW